MHPFLGRQAHGRAAGKQDPEKAWLRDVSNVALQQSLRHLDKSFANLFSGRARYPRFKSRRNTVQAASYMANGFSFWNGQFTLAKQDAPLALRWSRPYRDSF